ncbi:Coiled-coil domain-containing protein r3hcc1l [Apophysomyces sp. BC1034]|nr:Coiled-coil domain-containing protein r3hcc1l [Apophysomyces sp. BC1015]KAG0182691.1 Coiled-coil domain-containing protein r3hcc1l [Apophysomyces sp. BC1021]KAG0186295.1 Coiled-coil domain-containing protein r3hcc1l [Apophysomyces sp. BC1034]
MTEPKSKRSNFQPYIPVHRRHITASTTVERSARLARDETQNSDEVVRRGRGKFRAPGPQSDVVENSKESPSQSLNHLRSSSGNNKTQGCGVNTDEALDEINKDMGKLVVVEENERKKVNEEKKTSKGEKANEEKKADEKEEISEGEKVAEEKIVGKKEEINETEEINNEEVNEKEETNEEEEVDEVKEVNEAEEADEEEANEAEQVSEEVNETEKTSEEEEVDEVKEAIEAEQASEEEESEKEEWEALLDELDESESESTPIANSKYSASKRTVKADYPPSDDEPTVVLDCFDFPPTFKTHHIHDMFREYEQSHGGYRIKWVNDTRALIIFQHPATAKRAYIDNVSNPLAKVRPYTGPLDFMKANQVPIPRRPTTTDMVARRLVHGALGVRGPAKTTEQRQAEKDILKAARVQREAKRQTATRRTQDLADAFNE